MITHTWQKCLGEVVRLQAVSIVAAAAAVRMMSSVPPLRMIGERIALLKLSMD